MKTVTQEKINNTYDALKEKFGFKGPMEAYRIEKIVVSTGVGRQDKVRKNFIKEQLNKITGRKPKDCKAKKSIASFKLREGDIIGFAVTLRGKAMIFFLEKLIHIVLPRSHDFTGIKKEAVDYSGNLTIGIKEHTAFPETSDEESKNLFSLAITIVTTAPDREKATEFLTHIGIPFIKK